VTLTEAKAQLVVDYSTDDTFIGTLIKVAREYCENFTWRALAPQTLELILDDFPSSEILLPRPPLTSVTSIIYKSAANVETTMSASQYIVDADRTPGRIVPPYASTFPSFTPYPTSAVRVRYVAGYTTAPASIKQAMLLLIGHLYENREATTETNLKEVPLSIRSLLSPYKVFTKCEYASG
jgi:uncharacterized phiE125 gp8 family phage protein